MTKDTSMARSPIAPTPRLRRLAAGACAALTLGLTVGATGCDESAAPPVDGADADTTVAPTDAAAEVSQVADIDLSLPDSTTGDRNLRSGATAWVGHVTDGDTLTVWVGDMAPHSHVIRLVGLAAPECLKESRSTPDGFGNSCVSDDEIDGLASFQFLQALVEDKHVTVTCEAAPGAICPKDTYGRSLAYVAIDGKDAAVEMATAGHALSYVTFYSSKRAQICAGVYSARDKKIGMWALGSESYVISRMHPQTASWYNAQHDKKCDEALGR